MRADRQIDLAARTPKLIRDLGTRRARTNDHHRTSGQLIRAAISGGMHLGDAGKVRQNRRNDRGLKRPGRGDDIACLNRSL